MSTANEGSSSGLRDYRKGNWTVEETMVLIEAKKMDDERRMKRIIGDHNSAELATGRGKPTELRWKWVEDYCCKKGCFRSQNQCNDKWDNLMRDFKKVRDYERRIEKGKGGGDAETTSSSYWSIEKHERKERNLPSNMLPQIYEALMAVVDRKGGGLRQLLVPSPSPSSTNVNILSPHQLPPTTAVLLQLPALPPPPPPQPSPPTPLGLPVPPPPSAMPVYSHPLPAAPILGSIDSDTSEHSDSPAPAATTAAKRRRKGEVGGGSNASSDNMDDQVGTAICRSASIIAEAIKACEEREDRRHRDLVRLHERRLQIEESKAEMSRQGINGLVEAVNKLANSILVLASNKSTHQPSTSSK